MTVRSAGFSRNTDDKTDVQTNHGTPRAAERKAPTGRQARRVPAEVAATNPRRLILHADDFGFSAAINEGIIRGFTHGLLTSASVLANGEACSEALAAWITTGAAPPGMTALSPGRFGPLPDDELVSRGLWQYAHYYDPAAPDLE